MNIVITGAGGVLCSAFSRALAADGHKIALLDLNLEAAEREAEGIRKAGGEAIAVQANVLDKESLKKAHDGASLEAAECRNAEKSDLTEHITRAVKTNIR